MKLIIIITIFLLLSASQIWASTVQKKHSEMLYTVVTVESRALGSGTVVYSKKLNGNYETFILTNHHVVSSAIDINKEWDPIKKKKVDVEKLETVKIRWWDYNNLSRSVGTRGKIADIVAYDKRKDLALLKIRDKERGVKNIAIMRHPCKAIHLFDNVFAVGSGLGKPPFATRGVLSLLDEEINGHRYMLATAPIIYGNSGGALFRLNSDNNKYEFIGIPSRVESSYFQTVTHMGFSIPMQTVWEFLKKNKFKRILSSGCEKDK